VRKGLDRRQLGAVLGLTLGQLLRPGVDANTGVRSHPLRQIAVSMGLLGLVFATNLLRTPSWDLFLVRLFAATFLLLSLAIAPEPYELRERHREILASKPISARTLLVARCIQLLALSALIATAFGLVSFLAAAWRFQAPPLLAAAEYAMLVAGGFTSALLWLYAVLGALRFVRVETVRKAVHSALALFTVGLALFSLSLAAPGGGFDLGPEIRELLARLIAALPSTWFARFWLPGVAGAGVFERAGVVALAAGSVLLGTSGVLDRRYVHLVELTAQPPAGAVSPPRVVRLLAGLGRLPVLGPRLFPPSVTGVAAAVLTVTEREEISRLKIWLPRALGLVFFALGFHEGGAMLGLAMLSYLAFSGMVEGLDVTRHSAQADASWLFFASPLPRADVARGMMLAVTARFLALPLVLLGVLLFRAHPPFLAALLLLGTFFSACAVLAMALAAWPDLPLSRDQRATHNLVGFAAGFVLGIAGAVGYALATLVTRLLDGLGEALVAAGVAGLAALAIAARAFSARRLDRLEYRH